MANSNSTSERVPDTRLPLVGRRRPLKCLKEPHGFVSGIAQGNLGYQMQYAAKLLEEQLAEEGMPHVLQLDLTWEGDDWRNPTWWRLYADGDEACEGEGAFARQCFEEDAERFLEVLREAVGGMGLPRLSEREYDLLRRARDIARHEPYDEGSCALGGTPGRVF